MQSVRENPSKVELESGFGTTGLGRLLMLQRNAISQLYRKPLFTIEQANRTLPLVRRIVSDIITQYRQLEKLSKQRAYLLKKNRKDAVEMFDELARQGSQRLNELIDEVNSVGCELKDWESGQVDFRTLYEGREVCLCWQAGEDSILFWHELYAGPSERKPIDRITDPHHPRISS